MALATSLHKDDKVESIAFVDWKSISRKTRNAAHPQSWNLIQVDKLFFSRIYMQRVVKLWNQQQKLTKTVLRKIAQHLEDGAKKSKKLLSSVLW